MKIAIIGAGIAGVTTAYELAGLHHEVSVFDKHYACAEECSFANAGLASAYEVTPLARPGMARHLFTQLRNENKSIHYTNLKGSHLQWLYKLKKDEKIATFTKTYQELIDLQQFSQTCLKELREHKNINFENENGELVILRTEREHQMALPLLDVLHASNVPFELLTPEQAYKTEPALNTATPFEKAISFSNAVNSNCRQFIQQLKLICEEMGVTFHFNSEIFKLDATTRPTLWTNQQAHAFDAIVICTGIASQDLLRPLGIKLPMYAMFGHSISAAVREILDAPHSCVTDDRYKVSMARIGQRIRISGGFSLGHSNQIRQHRHELLYKVLDDWFPGAAKTHENIQIWHAAMPMMKDHKPVLGESGLKGVWLNLGHGQQGWALASGCARGVARQISSRQVEMDLSPFALNRFH